ncbi:rod-binding protein [Photobacterium chitinilyticum]|uniref:Flagellar protein n=1 Tax=Photobacterium chitinilyticum TaxID=2485123 RepID=A0A444JL01_9GAMM|nr:rod-binding protein [Photobacterium chitinilyticum]RWX53759.1 flagellar protein [Photobacterium chitinilyticum]
MKILENDNNSAMYNDLTSLQNIKANGDKTEALKQASGQFEAVFLQSVLKHMRQASDALNDEEDSLFNSRQQKFYRSMHDSQIAMEMSQQQSLGIADMLVRQLGQHDAFKPQPQLVAVNQQELKNASVAASPLLGDTEASYSKVSRSWWGNTAPLSQQLNIHLDDEEL